MNCWMTTHWPNWENQDPDIHEDIYLPDGREQAGKDLRPGDMVLIYESKTGRPAISYLDGRRISYHKGRGGIVAVAEVSSELFAR